MQLEFFRYFLWITTRKLHESVTNPIARKGQGTKSLAGCRGSAPAGVQRQSLWRLPSYPNSFTRWQATKCPFSTSLKGGIDCAQASVAWGQRVRNGQPDGAFRGLGMSPERTMRLFARAAFGSGSGTADKSDLEYGCSG